MLEIALLGEVWLWFESGMAESMNKRINCVRNNTNNVTVTTILSE